MIFLAFQELLYSFAASLSVLTELEQASIPKWMSVFLNCYRGEVVIARSQLFLQKVNTQINETKNKMHIRDSLHQSGDCQACQNQGACTLPFRQD